ncbi:MAG: magnesium/cobalt transporter CorA [Bacteroidetes bacterium]|nr:magnesium/cobalt transporter CorA [Bacteroidota bacterium]
MAKFTRRYNLHRVGLPPGSTDHIPVAESGLAGYKYNETEFERADFKNVEEISNFLSDTHTSWINVNGLNAEVVEKIGKALNIHPLFIEDILHLGQRPKVEEAEEYLYLVINMLDYNEALHEVTSEQVSFIITERHLFSFQEKQGDIFGPVRARLEAGKGKIRNNGADYLAYCLIDVVVDRFYLILEQLGNKIESLETQVINNPSVELLQEINLIKRDFIYLRKNIWPLREALNALQRPGQLFVSRNTRFYLKDVYDHTIQVMDSIDTYREMLSSILDIYMSSVSNKLNNVMKTLTTMASIFIPLTFLVGVYGMNFHNMPELEWEYGYHFIWGIMIMTAASLLLYFKRKNWM